MNNIDRLRLESQKARNGFVTVRLYDLRELLRKYDNAKSINRRMYEHADNLSDELLIWSSDVQRHLGNKKKFDPKNWPALQKMVSFLDSVGDLRRSNDS